MGEWLSCRYGYRGESGRYLDRCGCRRVYYAGCFRYADRYKLQVAAHAYSEQVLEVARQKKTTPKFERAKSMTFQDRKLIYISGTAAIRGEESLTGVGLERQLRITMENIAELTR